MYFKLFAKKHILDGPGMINPRDGEIVKVTYYSGGGMEGSSLYYNISCQPETALFEYEYCPSNGAQTTTVSREVSLVYFDDFRQICRDTECLINIDSGKPGELILLDAPVSTITFTLESGEMLTFHSDYEYPSRCSGLFTSVISLFGQILAEAQK
ncbi:MAG: hypothetical protein IKA10_08805 [Oscillospiraceae bacterium]|nr:hypothetical protein [Oscillospiraceae bacterium]